MKLAVRLALARDVATEEVGAGSMRPFALAGLQGHDGEAKAYGLSCGLHGCFPFWRWGFLRARRAFDWLALRWRQNKLQLGP